MLKELVIRFISVVLALVIIFTAAELWQWWHSLSCGI